MVPMLLSALAAPIAPIALAASLATASAGVGDRIAVSLPDLSEITAPGPSVSRRESQSQVFETPSDMAEVTGGGVDLTAIMTPAALEAMCAAAELDRNKVGSGLQAIHGVCSKREGSVKSVLGSPL